MKYFFITILHNMGLSVTLNKGFELSPGTRITNGSQIREEILKTDLMMGTLGVHSVDEFNNTVYYYRTGEFSDIKTQDEMDQIGTAYTFYFLREAQDFATDLWLIKDNGIYIRDGFLITYRDKIEYGRTFKASLTETFKAASGEYGEFVFTKKEVEAARNTFDPFPIEEMNPDNMGMKYPNFDHFYKSGNAERMHKATYFTLGARTNAAIPMKIVSYCTALECLFSTAKTEINHRIAERVATMLGTSPEDKKDLFKFIKKAYDYRSTIVHGSNIKGTEDILVPVSARLDDILRQLLSGNHEIFTKSDADIDEFFINLIFN